MTTPHRIAVLAVEPAIGFDLSIAPMVFGEAVDDSGEPLYRTEVVGLGGHEVRTSAGYAIIPGADESALTYADTVIVPGTRLPGPRTDATLPADLAAALDLIRPSARIMSICTGAFVLAAAGLLDGHRVTTHWRRAADLARLYPRLEVDPEVLFIDDGKVLTSAGLAAGIDLCLHVLRRDHGPALANRVARYCVVPPWREGGQAQFIEHPVPRSPDASTAGVRQWAVHHLDRGLDVGTLARRAGMSNRTFARRFRAETGQAPGAWLIEQRVRRAQELLEGTDLPIETVAARAGLGSAASLRHHLRTYAGVSPKAYRRTFRGSEVT